MESFLNIAWVILAAVSVGCWLWNHPRHSGGPLARKRWERGLVALVYALALLFPVISLTDDLHTELAIVEDSVSKRVKAGGQHTSLLGHPDSLAVAGTNIAIVPGLPKHTGCSGTAIHLNPSLLLPRTSSGRSPPFLT